MGADDNLTARLMEHFYQHLADGDDKASALRTAKLDVIRQFGPQAVPFLWAGFEVYGDGPGHLRKP
jgi:CHAT domain-containing protein